MIDFCINLGWCWQRRRAPGSVGVHSSSCDMHWGCERGMRGMGSSTIMVGHQCQELVQLLHYCNGGGTSLRPRRADAQLPRCRSPRAAPPSCRTVNSAPKCRRPGARTDWGFVVKMNETQRMGLSIIIILSYFDSKMKMSHCIDA